MINVADFKAGDRVRAKEAIYEPADDHAPGGYLCQKGDLLIVRKLTPEFKRSLSVSHELETKLSFGVEPCEVEPDVVAAPVKTWQHDETGRITEAAECPGPRWAAVPSGVPGQCPTCNYQLRLDGACINECPAGVQGTAEGQQ